MREDVTSAIVGVPGRRDGIRAARPARGAGGRPLLASKLTAAPLPDALVVRPRLHRLLDTAGPVTLLTAPAGWGKTLLLSCWHRDRGGPGARAWLSVEPSDAGGRLWSYVCAALSSAGEESAPLPAAEEPSDEEFLTRLAAALARRAEPVVLVLDDVHRVDDPAVFDGLDFLLRHAGDRLRLVLGSRTEPALPLHRRRLGGELTEIRAADLAFSPAESAALLAAHGVNLPAADVARLHERTEGWPAGLRLAALALRDYPDPARFVGGFGGDHPAVAEYLTEEVLGPLPAEVRDVLVRSSVAERLDGDLVDTLTGRTDGDDLLREVQRSVGFLIGLGGQPGAYRWHRLFGDLLRARLARCAPQQVLDLHRRVAVWHRDHGFPADALRHALAAGADDTATALLVERWPELLPYGAPHTAGPVAAAPSQAVRADPELALAYAADRLARHDLDGADRHLRLAAEQEHLLGGERRRRCALIRAAFDLARAQLGGGDVPAAARHLLALVPVTRSVDDAPAHRGARAVARAALGPVRFAIGDLAGAETELRDGRTEAERAGLLRPALVGAGRLAWVLAARGRLRAAEDTAREVLAVAAQRPGPAEHPDAHLALAMVALHRDRTREAEAHLALAGGVGFDGAGYDGGGGYGAGGAGYDGAGGYGAGGYGYDGAAYGGGPTGALIALTRAQLLRDRGELTVGYQTLLAGRGQLTERVPPYLSHWFVAVEAELRTARGDLDTARRLLLPLVDGGAEPLGPLTVALARVYLKAGDARGAARMVGGWDRQDDEGSWPLPVRLDAGLLDALAAGSLGERHRAARALEQVLRLAEPEGFRRVFTRAEPSARDLLAGHLDTGTAYWPLVSELITIGDPKVAPRERAAEPPVPGEPLTERELTILRYLQSILSNVEIASELSLSVNTVKTHVRNIYRKLDASRRREAVRRARELHLL